MKHVNIYVLPKTQVSFIFKAEAFLGEFVLAARGCKAVSEQVHASPTPLRPNPPHHVFPLYR